MKKLICSILFIFCSVYLLAMNSTENRQRICDNTSISFLNYKKAHIAKFPHDQDYMIDRCYRVYLCVVDMRQSSDSFNQTIQSRLVATGFCDLDEGVLVLKGFAIEDSLRLLTGCKKVIK